MCIIFTFLFLQEVVKTKNYTLRKRKPLQVQGKGDDLCAEDEYLVTNFLVPGMRLQSS